MDEEVTATPSLFSVFLPLFLTPNCDHITTKFKLLISQEWMKYTGAVYSYTRLNHLCEGLFSAKLKRIFVGGERFGIDHILCLSVSVFLALPWLISLFLWILPSVPVSPLQTVHIKLEALPLFCCSLMLLWPLYLPFIPAVSTCPIS